MATSLIENRAETVAVQAFNQWHSSFDANGARAALESEVLTTRQAVSLSSDVPVEAGGNLTARLELGTFSESNGRRSIELGVRLAEVLPATTEVSVLGGSPVGRARDGRTLRTAFIPFRDITGLQEIVPTGVLVRLSQGLRDITGLVRTHTPATPSVNGVAH